MPAEKVKSELSYDNVITENSDTARELFKNGVYGSEQEDASCSIVLTNDRVDRVGEVTVTIVTEGFA